MPIIRDPYVVFRPSVLARCFKIARLRVLAGVSKMYIIFPLGSLYVSPTAQLIMGYHSICLR